MGAALDTISYGYGDSSWKDLLTSYDGQALTTDAIGNLTNDGTWSYSWQHGRQLKQMSRPDASGDTEMICFRYDSGGHRIGKDSGVYHASYSGGEIVYAGETTRTSYSYLGDTLTQVNIDAPTGSTSLHFTYDEIGPMSVTYDGAEYFYLKNAQGDVTGLVNSSGTQVVAYTYDAWGNPLTTTGTMADTLGKLNPFRYRGYVYDTETGLYYLQSRYYNPETGRFVNADGYVSTGQGIVGNNMFAYAINNPISYSDHSGNFAISTAIAIIAAVALSYVGAIAATSPKFRRDISSAANYLYDKAQKAADKIRNSTKSVEKTRDKRPSNNTVYQLVDNTGQPQYIGRTTNLEARKESHAQNPYRKDLKLEVIASNLTYEESRGLEQIAMLQCHTLNPGNYTNNQINGISPFNPRLSSYMDAGRNIAIRYWENQITNEILYWTGR